MRKNVTITSSQGPSAHNQTSEDHSLDSNQKARQPSTRDVIKAEGLDRQSDTVGADMSAATID